MLAVGVDRDSKVRSASGGELEEMRLEKRWMMVIGKSQISGWMRRKDGLGRARRKHHPYILDFCATNTDLGRGSPRGGAAKNALSDDSQTPLHSATSSAVGGLHVSDCLARPLGYTTSLGAREEWISSSPSRSLAHGWRGGSVRPVRTSRRSERHGIEQKCRGLRACTSERAGSCDRRFTGRGTGWEDAEAAGRSANLAGAWQRRMTDGRGMCCVDSTPLPLRGGRWL